MRFVLGGGGVSGDCKTMYYTPSRLRGWSEPPPHSDPFPFPANAFCSLRLCVEYSCFFWFM
jgi:hypothetical protein